MLLTTVAFDRFVREDDSGGLTALLLASEEPARRSFLARIEERLTDGFPPHVIREAAGFYALAVIGCAPSAARAAALLGRGELRQWHIVPITRFLEIARARQLDWVGDLGVRLAKRIRAGELLLSAEWDFVVALLDEGKADPPVTEGVVLAWLRSVHHGRPSALPRRLRASRFLDLLLPAVFAIDGLGSQIPAAGWDGTTWDPVPALPAALARLTAEGRLDRAALLAATIDRLVRGDRPAALRPFVLLHDALAPAAAEVAAHLPSYATLLASAPSPIAGLAQRTLRAAGCLPGLDVSADVLARPEKGLVKAQLTWLDRAARADPSQAAAIAGVAAVALRSPVLDIQEQAGALIARYRPLAPPAAPAPPPAAFRAPPSTRAVMPPPIGTAAELAEEYVAVLRDPSAVRWERILAALVSLPPDGFRETLEPVLTRNDRSGHRHIPALDKAIRARAGLPFDPDVEQRMLALVEHAWSQAFVETPADILTLRLAELAVQLTRSPIPVLLATPTHVTGSLDPAVLIDRLARVETPWELDFQQALLRLPRVAEPAVLARAEALTGPHGRRLATWLRTGGLPDPVSTRREQRSRQSPGDRRLVVDLESSRADPGRILLEDAVVTLTRPAEPRSRSRRSYRPDVLATALPHHREVVAAWALPDLAALADQDARDASLLPLLADAEGPLGPATALAVTYGLGARHTPDRVAAVDAFLSLCSSPGFPAAVGTELGDLGSDGTIKLTRVTEALTEAHHAGATAEVWHLLATALPHLLTTTPHGLPALLELATTTVTALSERATIPADVPGLAALARRPGGSRLLREARRLQAALERA
ncbi:hypothetical protein ACTI_80150 [Actinoplanes sp. OR16]|uniref:hypothetical protein n=1 Tax=Actinoplanes sp. OR16 TaxID=946334 RepID=UPI000F6DBAD6|nr:hypothetical protein [Actinoplanes sp. OR16]BBH71330.1 hypothetical protein ACTI_80150 [Actinoplanes sp. OR16]